MPPVITDARIYCPACGYNLTGAVERCPECGADIATTLRARASRDALLNRHLFCSLFLPLPAMGLVTLLSISGVLTPFTMPPLVFVLALAIFGNDVRCAIRFSRDPATPNVWKALTTVLMVCLFVGLQVLMTWAVLVGASGLWPLLDM